MRVRPATLKDLDGMMRIEELCFGDERFDRGTVRAYIGRRDAFAMIAVEGGVIAGAAMAAVSKRLDCGRIGSVAVLDSFRGKGLGRKLLEACEKEFRRRGVGRFMLEVAVDNQDAVRLYENSGYKVIGVAEGYYSNGKDAYVMEKSFGMTGRRVKVRPS
ncbi:TPA: GNAT family N-acetyltransferase [Thermoplasmata archaeon]|nr:GNAT family N-acetyltransferase [Thermoplasmata archaeon]